MVLWVQFPVGPGSSHTKDSKRGSGPCLHGTQDHVGTTKHDWSAWCQYNVTGWVNMWAYDMTVRQHYKQGIVPQIGTSSHRCGHCPCGMKQLVKSMILRQSGKSSLMSWSDFKLIPKTNKLLELLFHFT